MRSGCPRHAGEPWPTIAPDHGAPEAVPNVEALDLAGDRSAGALLTLGRAAAGVAHDLNNVLTPIIMGLDLMREPAPDEQAGVGDRASP